MHRLDDMALFARLAEHGNFTRTAEAEGLPLATLSRRIASLEAHLGVKLLHRTTRRMRLTEAGAEYLDYCRRVAAEAEAAEAALAAKQAAPTGVLKVTAPPLIAEWLLAPAIAAFAERHPAVHLDLFLTDRRVALADEGFDVAIRVGALPDSALVVRRLCAIAHSLYASPAYLRRNGTPRREADLARHARLLFGTSAPMPWSRAKKWRPPPGPSPILVNGFALLKAMAVAGRGIALLPDFVCKPEVAAGTLRAIPSPDWGFVDDVQIVTLERRGVSAKLRAFVDTLVEVVGDRAA
jgi:DNA-binding transcriptional LysR family regulator